MEFREGQEFYFGDMADLRNAPVGTIIEDQDGRQSKRRKDKWVNIKNEAGLGASWKFTIIKLGKDEDE